MLVALLVLTSSALLFRTARFAVRTWHGLRKLPLVPQCYVCIVRANVSPQSRPRQVYILVPSIFNVWYRYSVILSTKGLAWLLQWEVYLYVID